MLIIHASSSFFFIMMMFLCKFQENENLIHFALHVHSVQKKHKIIKLALIRLVSSLTRRQTTKKGN